MDKEIQAKFDELESTISDLKAIIDTLLGEFNNHHHTGLDSQQIDGTSLKETPFAKVAAPADSTLLYSQSNAQEAVDAINLIISILETTKITSDQ